LEDVELRGNDVGLFEIPIDLEEVVLQGAGDSLNDIEEIISKFRLDLNLKQMKYDAHQACLTNDLCSLYFESTKEQIVTANEEEINNSELASLAGAEDIIAEELQHLEDAAASSDEMDFFTYEELYYTTTIPQ